MSLECYLRSNLFRDKDCVPGTDHDKSCVSYAQHKLRDEGEVNLKIIAELG
jgi:hypothetical protein